MIISPAEFDYEWFKKIPLQKRKKGNPGGSRGITYKDIICAFDIETTTISEIVQSFMYIWQWQIGPEVTVIGRTWNEYLDFQKRLAECLPENVYLVSFIHNASYEFQYITGIYKFKKGEVFALDSRKVAKFTMNAHFEFRCSYIHSNLSLSEYLKKMNVKDQKLSGADFDYSKIRYPWTKLSDQELKYCINDVLGLVEAIETDIKIEDDNLYTFPLTVTGYPRRDLKRAMKMVSHFYVERQLPNYHIYCMLREAFRGGDTHASRFYAGKTLDERTGFVYSDDRSSSYPDVMCNCKFPSNRFFEMGSISPEKLMDTIYRRGKAVLMRIAFFNIEVNLGWGCPYLGKSKCWNIRDAAYDNGRILKAEYLETCITDIDFKIICKEYHFDDFTPYDVAHAKYDYLPQPFIKTVINYYKMKTELKGDDSQKLFYDKAKSKLNSLYGMTAQDVCKITQVYDEEGWHWNTEKTEVELLQENNKRAVLPYQVGIWVTAWARYRLHEALWLTREEGTNEGENSTQFVYCDTDSVKHIGTIDFSSYNDERIKDSLKSGAFATDSKGVTHYMGVLEPDGKYKSFKTLGAKKYVYTEEDDSLHVTISGVNKTKGAKELQKHGGMSAFKEGFIFKEAGGTESVYNDQDKLEEAGIYEYIVDGKSIPITANIVIRDSTYTLGITDEYQLLLSNPNFIERYSHNNA